MGKKYKRKSYPRQQKYNSEIMAEIRFVKEQQWKPVYYPLLLFSALVIIFSQDIITSSINEYYTIIKILSFALIGIVTVISIFFQWTHFNALQKYRKHPDIGRSKSKAFVSVVITGTFNAIILSGGIIAWLYLCSKN